MVSVDAELVDMSFEVILLAYSPDEVLEVIDEQKLYIPDTRHIENAFNYALKNICKGDKSVKLDWNVIQGSEILRERVYKGVRVLMENGDFPTDFSYRMNYSINDLEVVYIGNEGIYRFNDRENAIRRFESFWDSEEQWNWWDIHEGMREFGGFSNV